MIYLITFFLTVGSLIALAAKWELNKKIAISWALIMGLLACCSIIILRSGGSSIPPAAQVLAALVASSFISLIAILAIFFRDPDRDPPKDEGAVISPADGFVRYVKEIQAGEFPFALKNGRTIPLTAFTEHDLVRNGGIQIGITMTLLDVHMTRSPIAGEFSYLKRIPGKFHSLKRMSSLLENERVVGVVRGTKASIGIVLIASRLVRRIVVRIEEGQSVAAGQRIGMIRFGSQVDILIPRSDSLKVTVKPGEKVKAGETIIARM